MGLVNVDHQYKHSVPHEEREYIMFRNLTGAELEHAKDMGAKKQFEIVKTLGNAFIQEVLKAAKPTPADAVESKAYKNQYDFDTLIDLAIVDWSYVESCTAENKRLLDSATRAWAVDTIVDMNMHSPLPNNG